MKVYNYKYHATLSIIISGIIGGLSFFIIEPSEFPSVKGELISQAGKLISRDTGQVVIQQINVGYDTVVTVIIISLLIMLSLYKPIKKIMNR